jgi:hypothetical protein
MKYENPQGKDSMCGDLQARVDSAARRFFTWQTFLLIDAASEFSNSSFLSFLPASRFCPGTFFANPAGGSHPEPPPRTRS